MFGLDALASKGHLVSRLILAGANWLIEPGNPVFSKIPAAVQPEVLAELKSEIASREAILSTAEAKKAVPST